MMKILIAESKTMVGHQLDYMPAIRERHVPDNETLADTTMASVAEMSLGELIETTRYSPMMASRLRRMAYEFPNKRLGLKAVEAFTGVVFRNFEYKRLSDEARAAVDKRLRIVSSLYGWLRPDDVIKPYRMDYATGFGPDGEAMWKAQREGVTACLAKELSDEGERDVLGLLPGDAMKCIDVSAVGDDIRFWKAEFREVDGSSLRSPHATKLKALRGRLLKAIFENNLDTIEKIADYSDTEMMGQGVQDGGRVITFLV